MKFSFKKNALWMLHVVAASTLLIFAHTLYTPARMHGFEAPSFALWRFFGAGLIAAVVLLVIAFFLPATTETKFKWTSLSDRVGLGFGPDKQGILFTALSTVGFVLSMTLLVDGLSRYGMINMNVPMSAVTILISVAFTYFVKSQDLNVGQIIGSVIIIIGLLVFLFMTNVSRGPTIDASPNAAPAKKPTKQ